jgi:hypothetical protein
MTDVVNLRTVRKRAARQQAEKNAVQNRLAHGRPKSQRKLEVARGDKACRDLEMHRIERGDTDEIAGH